MMNKKNSQALSKEPSTRIEAGGWAAKRRLSHVLTSVLTVTATAISSLALFAASTDTALAASANCGTGNRLVIVYDPSSSGEQPVTYHGKFNNDTQVFIRRYGNQYGATTWIYQASNTSHFTWDQRPGSRHYCHVV